MADDSRLLGPIIKAWFKANQWPQSVTEGLARAKGWEAGPWASQISICMSGRLQPKPPFFVALGMFNQAVAERDFVGVTDRRLMDRLMAGQPITHEDGVPWDAMDFFGAYIGAVQPPKSLNPQIEKEITQEDMDHWVHELQLMFRELVLAVMDPGGPAAVWQRVAERIVKKGFSPEEVSFTQEVLSGLRKATVEEGKRFAFKYPDRPLVVSLMEEMEAVKGNNSRGQRLEEWRSKLPVTRPEPPAVL